jgi:hypothetical protein
MINKRVWWNVEIGYKFWLQGVQADSISTVTGQRMRRKNKFATPLDDHQRVLGPSN